MLRYGMLMVGVLCTLPAAAAPQVTLFVSPEGRDRWSGTLPAPNRRQTDGPFATLERARDAVRRLRAPRRRAAHPAPDVVVMLRGGTHTLPKTLTFRPEDSGEERHPVVYTAYPGEVAVVSGGRRIRGWRRGEGLLWVASVPKGWYFTRLFVNGRRAQRAREPDTDNWHRWPQVVEGGPPDPDAPEGMGSRMLRLPPGITRAWPNPGDIEINSLPSFRYANFIAPVQSVDAASGMVTLTAQAYYNFQRGDPFRVENAPEALDQPGEWCLDSTAGAVTYWPRDGEAMDAADVVAPALTELVRLQGDEQAGRTVHDVAFRGITFTHCDRRRWHERPPADEANLHLLDAAVYLEATERCAIEQCRFVDVAGFGARLNLTARDNRFVSNEVVGAGCGGLQAGGYGPGTRDVNHGHTITHNHIHHSSTDFWHAGAIDLRQSGGNLIAHNLIHDMPYTAICVSGAHTAYFKQYSRKGPGQGRAQYNFRWEEIPAENPLTTESVKPFLHGRNNVVEQNVVYEVLGRLPADGGALYGFGQGLGNVFRRNVVYRAHCLAIYLDNEFDGVRVQENVVYDSASPFGGSGANPEMAGNLLYAAGQAPVEVRLLGQRLTRMAEQATGPSWHRTVSPEEERRARDPGAREFAAKLAGLGEDDLPGQGGWELFGPGAAIALGPGTRTGGFDPGIAAIASGIDSWAAIGHGLVLDPARDLVLWMDAFLPDPLQGNSFFELYLNAGALHTNEAFGIALVGGAQEKGKDEVGVRQDSAGPRVLSTERLKPGHWYRLRLRVPAAAQQGTLSLMDLTAGEKEPRGLPLPAGAMADLTRGEQWSPRLADLDTLVLRLGGGAQATNVLLQNTAPGG